MAENHDTGAPAEKSEQKQNVNKMESENIAVPALTTTTGAIVGGVATAGPAITVAGTGGLTGYAAGLSTLIAHAGCKIAAASTLSVVAAGPVIGGIAGYTLYRALKR